MIDDLLIAEDLTGKAEDRVNELSLADGSTFAAQRIWPAFGVNNDKLRSMPVAAKIDARRELAVTG